MHPSPELSKCVHSLTSACKGNLSEDKGADFNFMPTINPRRHQTAGRCWYERIGIPLDAATEELFDKIKGLHVGGPYSWKRQFELLNDAVSIFGKSKVSTHFIAGLGETEKEMVNAIQRCVDMGVLPALFAFTSIPGTALEDILPPSVERYRRIQLARHLISHGSSRSDAMQFNEDGCLIDWGVEKNVLVKIIRTGEPFLTSGCPNCNRPFYNEKPSGPIYNHPKPLTDAELAEAKKELSLAEA